VLTPRSVVARGHCARAGLRAAEIIEVPETNRILTPVPLQFVRWFAAIHSTPAAPHGVICKQMV
jgi:hypothetical protein